MAIVYTIKVNDKGLAVLNQHGIKVKKLTKTTKEFGSVFKGVFGAALLLKGLNMAGAAVKKFIGEFGEVAKIGDQFDKMSKRVGASVEFLSEFGHVATLAGSSIERIEPSMKRLARTMSDANTGLSTAKRAFQDLGINVNDANGELKSVDTVILEVAGRFQNMTDHTKKLALAQEVFGRAGADMLPILNQGTAAIKAQMEEAKALGISLTTEAAVGAAEFVDAMARMTGAFKGIRRESILPLLDKLTPIINQLALNMKNLFAILDPVKEAFMDLFPDDLIGKAANTEGQLSLVAGSMETLAKTAIIAITAFNVLKTSFENIVLLLRTVMTSALGAANAILGIFSKDARERADIFFELSNEQLNQMTDNSIDLKDELSKLPGIFDKISAAAKKVRIQEVAAIVTPTTAPAAGAGFQDIQAAENEKNQLLAFMGESRIALIENEFDREREVLTNWLIEKMDIVAGSLEGQRLLEEISQQKITEINKKESDKRIANYKREQNIRHATTMAILGMAGALAGSFGELAKEQGASGKTIKKHAIAETIINTAAAAISAYRSMAVIPIVGPGLAVAAAGVAVATGLAQLAIIEGQNFASGTQFAPGGRARVADRGAEVVLPRGAEVLNDTTTADILGGQLAVNDAVNFGIGKGGREINININTMIGSDEYVRDVLLPTINSELARI